MKRLFLVVAAALVLVGCQTPPPIPAAEPAAAPAEGASSAFCTLVSTFTTTVRAVVLQVAKGDDRSFEVRGDTCTLKARAPTAIAAAASAPK